MTKFKDPLLRKLSSFHADLADQHHNLSPLHLAADIAVIVALAGTVGLGVLLITLGAVLIIIALS